MGPIWLIEYWQKIHFLVEFTEMFELFDSDGSGLMAADDLGMALRALGHVLTEAEVLKLRQDIDINGKDIFFFFFYTSASDSSSAWLAFFFSSLYMYIIYCIYRPRLSYLFLHHHHDHHNTYSVHQSHVLDSHVLILGCPLYLCRNQYNRDLGVS